MSYGSDRLLDNLVEERRKAQAEERLKEQVEARVRLLDTMKSRLSGKLYGLLLGIMEARGTGFDFTYKGTKVSLYMVLTTLKASVGQREVVISGDDAMLTLLDDIKSVYDWGRDTAEEATDEL